MMKIMKFTTASLFAAAMMLSTASAVIIDISSQFNLDTFADPDTDSAGSGFGSLNDKWLVSSSTTFPSGGGTFNAEGGGPEFSLGSYAGVGGAASNNTVKFDIQTAVTIDIPDQVVTTLYALYVGSAYTGSKDGTFKFNYTDASSSSDLTWDARDSGSGGSDPIAISNVTLRRFANTNSYTGRNIYYSTFVNPDAGKTVDSITFSTVGMDDDPGNDADYGIYSINAIPEPNTFGLVMAGLLGLVFLRRNARQNG